MGNHKARQKREIEKGKKMGREEKWEIEKSKVDWNYDIYRVKCSKESNKLIVPNEVVSFGFISKQSSLNQGYIS